MPHKRAKRSVREQQNNQKGRDLAPAGNISNEGIPKSIARILNAVKIREEFKEKKRAAAYDAEGGHAKKRRKQAGEEDKTAGPGQKSISIQPGESLAHFNRRVEDDMRSLVRSAIQSSSANERKSRAAERDKSSKKPSQRASSPERDSKDRKRNGKARPDVSPPPSDKHAGKAKEFLTLSTSAPRRLNDIAMAPPELKKLPRGASKGESGNGLGKGSVLSMAQRVMMEVERVKAIKHYRELKEMKIRENGGSWSKDQG